jgi:hypothetical protein
MLVHTYNWRSQEYEAGGSQVKGHPELHSEFKDSLGCIARSYLKIKKAKLSNNSNLYLCVYHMSSTSLNLFSFQINSLRQLYC